MFTDNSPDSDNALADYCTLMADYAQYHTELRRAIDTINPDFREVILLRYAHDMSVRENTTLPCLPVEMKGGILSRKKENEITQTYIEQLDIKTPGAEQKVLNLSEITTLVLDEADRMLDMGFVEDIEFILKAMPAQRHTMLFSATMQENVKQLAFDYMKNPKEVSVSKDEVVLDLTKQYYISVGRRNKSWALCRILDIDKPKAIIFCQTKKMVDTLDERLTKYGYKVEAIHGDMPQSKREKVMADFKEDGTDILIATDVAARGLDVDDITYVVNYDMPDDIDTYIHRIGRTGRAGKEGTAVSFVTSEEEHLVKEFEMRTGMEIEKRDVPDAEPGQKDTIRRVVDYDQISDVFGMCRFEINLGKKDGFGKVSLADFIIRNARVRDVSIGKINVGPESSIVEVHKDFGNRMTMDLPKAKYKNKKIQVRVIQD